MVVNFSIIILLLKEAIAFGRKIVSAEFIIPTIFLLWAIIGIIRGYFVADDYWSNKQLMEGGIILSLPLCVFAFSDPDLDFAILRRWTRWMAPLFFIFFIWILKPSGYQFLIWPVFFYAIFYPKLPFHWRMGILAVFLVMVSFGFSNRAQLIKVAISIFLGLSYILRGYFTEKIIIFLHWCFYIIAVFFLYQGITGSYNIFEKMEDKKGLYSNTVVDNQGYKHEEDLADDTRTFIYQEVVISAVENDYVLAGRTPARGNDSLIFGKQNAEIQGNNRFERHSNEVCHPNIFTWLGLIGVILYSAIYFRASWLAVYKSNCYALKFIGCFIAFHWTMGWIEDMNRFDISNIFMWMCIAMGLSPAFREMTDEDFNEWFYGIFAQNDENDEYEDEEEETNSVLQ